MTRGFSMAGSDGSELGVYTTMLEKGYEELYYNAPYYWGIINVPENKIFTYTEGDTLLIECPTTQHLYDEAKSYIDFILKDYERSGPLMTGEWKFVEEKIQQKLTKEAPA